MAVMAVTRCCIGMPRLGQNTRLGRHWRVDSAWQSMHWRPNWPRLGRASTRHEDPNLRPHRRAGDVSTLPDVPRTVKEKRPVLRSSVRDGGGTAGTFARLKHSEPGAKHPATGEKRSLVGWAMAHGSHVALTGGSGMLRGSGTLQKTS